MKNQLLLTLLIILTALQAPTLGEDVNLRELVALDESVLRLMPKNLARWHMAASLILVDEKGRYRPLSINEARDVSAAAFLHDDETLTYRLESGPYSIILDLGDFYPLDRFFFLSLEAIGTLDVAVSTTLRPLSSNRWNKVVDGAEYASEAANNYTFPIAEARYVLLQFQTEKPGDIGFLGVYGQTSIAETEFQREKAESAVAAAEEGETIGYDYASLYTGCEITHISSGDFISANVMIDDDFLTYYEFSPDEPEAILLLDIKESSRLNKLSMLFDSDPATLEFYIVNDLEELFAGEVPEFASNDRSGKIRVRQLTAAAGPFRAVMAANLEANTRIVTLASGFFDEREPIVTHVAEQRVDRVRLQFEFENITGRYLLLRWRPNRSIGGEKEELARAEGGEGTGISGSADSLGRDMTLLERRRFISAVRAAGGVFLDLPFGGGLRIYDISLSGDLPTDAVILARLLGLQFGPPPTESDELPFTFTTGTSTTAPQVPVTSF